MNQKLRSEANQIIAEVLSIRGRRDKEIKMLLEGKPFMTEFVKEGYDCKK